MYHNNLFDALLLTAMKLYQTEQTMIKSLRQPELKNNNQMSTEERVVSFRMKRQAYTCCLAPAN
jgi:hypothetical protein